jgi:murein DD-endopeptidase / murein LD-carboxypeptidase
MEKFNKKLVSLGLGLAITLSAGLSVVPTSAFAASTTSSATASQIIAAGQQYMGVPYVFGGHSPSGFDCQGLMKFIFGQYGISLPSGARNQSTAGTEVSRDQLQPGDLVFFSTASNDRKYSDAYHKIGHVGVYMGNGQVLHTYGSPGVTISNMNSGWWSNHYITARRVLSGNGQASSVPTNPAQMPVFQPVQTQPVQNLAKQHKHTHKKHKGHHHSKQNSDDKNDQNNNDENN